VEKCFRKLKIKGLGGGGNSHAFQILRGGHSKKFYFDFLCGKQNCANFEKQRTALEALPS